jgi:hypothetical protein
MVLSCTKGGVGVNHQKFDRTRVINGGAFDARRVSSSEGIMRTPDRERRQEKSGRSFTKRPYRFKKNTPMRDFQQEIKDW